MITELYFYNICGEGGYETTASCIGVKISQKKRIAATVGTSV